MIEGCNVIGSSTSKAGTQTLQAMDQQENRLLPESFSIATKAEMDLALNKASEAFEIYKQYSGQQKAAFLEVIADEIIALGEELIDRATAESGLPAGRLEGERGRTVGQLRLFAEVLREGSWVDARIDKATEAGPDVRSMLFPLGPVVVFGASNFPLAFSTAGGDTASALAAGCPLIIKAHESHLGTNELVAKAISKAAKKTDMPDGVFSSLNGGKEVGAALVRHPAVKAVGFTGSFGGGKALYDLAQQREEPIPVYAEMGSINPVFLLHNKLSAEAEALGQQYAASVSLGVGQFCTNPGLIIGLKSEVLNMFKESLTKELKDTPPACMLNAGIAKNYRQKRAEALRQAGVTVLADRDATGDIQGAPGIASISAADFLANGQLQEEIFGPFTLVVECNSPGEVQQVASSLNGQLTLTFMGTDTELASHKELIATSREKAGRLIFNGVPTGVRVSYAMQHGGPFPATTDAKFTSVGTSAIRRFVRPVAFQDCPPVLLPAELKDDNPLNITRIWNGDYKVK